MYFHALSARQQKCCGVGEPVFGTKEEAISYAQVRGCFRSGEIRILDLSGTVESVISFADSDRKM